MAYTKTAIDAGPITTAGKKPSKWTCSITEFKKTFDALDEATVEYEITRVRACLKPLFAFACFDFAIALVLLGMIGYNYFMRGRKNSKRLPCIRFVILIVEVVLLIQWFLLIIDALS